MYLSKLKIKNFRAIKELEIPFKKGVTIIVGENNAGKTAVMDALRMVMIPSSDYDAYRVSVDDFHEGNTDSPIGVSVELTDLSPDDEIRMFEALVFKSDNEMSAQLNSFSEYNVEMERIKTRMSGGVENAGSAIFDVHEHLDVTYLKPLRDPSQALKSGRFSCPAKFFSSNLSETQKRDLEDIARSINDGLMKEGAIVDAQLLYNKIVKDIVGERNKQDIQLLFNEPEFVRLISDIKTRIDSREYNLNGLGLNNIIVIALVIAAHRRNSKDYQLLLIEEPEAHLHPLLQRLLLTYLKNTIKDGNGNTQIIISTHSPVLASKAEVECICHIHKDVTGVQAVSLKDIVSENNSHKEDLNALTTKLKKKLERFLDATRAELFFTKKVILVEGVGEMLLVPVIAKMVGCDLDENNVTLINCMGLNFDMFIPILEKIGIRAAIITDDDSDKKRESLKAGEISSSAKKIEEVVKTSDVIEVFLTPKTFEKALFVNNRMKNLAVRAVGNLGHSKLERELQSATSEEMYEKLFGDGRNTVKKGELAQEMVFLLELQMNDGKNPCKNVEEDIENISVGDFPENIIEAINYVCR